MDNYTVKTFTNLTPDQQTRLNCQERKNMMEIRAALKRKGYDTETIWYTKLDYITNYTLHASLILDVCNTCQTVIGKEAECISDKAAPCEGREVTYRCNCGQYYVMGA